MAASLGSFSVDVMANIARFESDLGRANRVAQREAEKIKRTFVGLAGSLGVGVSVNAFAGWIKGAIDAQDKADELAQKIGLTTGQMSKLQVAAKFSSTDVDGLGKAMSKMSQNAAAAATGSKAQAAAFSSIGVAVTDVNGKVRDSYDIFTDVAEKFAGFEGGINKTAMAVKLFGKSGTDLIPMFNEWNGNVAEAIKLAEEFGAIVTDKAGAGAARFNDQLAKLDLVSKGVANQIAGALVPAFNDLADASIRFFRSDDWKRVLANIATGAKAVGDNLDRIIGAIKLLGTLAVAMIAGKLANSLALAAFNAVKLSRDMAIAAAVSRDLGMSASTAFAGMNRSILGSIKTIGLVPLAIGSVMAAFAGWQIGTYLREQFLEVRLAGLALVEGLLVGWERIKQGALLSWEVIKHGFDVFVGAAKSGLATVVDALGLLASAQGNIAAGSLLGSLADNIRSSIEPAGTLADKLGAVNAQANGQVKAIRDTFSALADYEIGADLAGKAAKTLADRVNEVSYANLEAKKGSKEYLAAVDQINRAANTAIASGVKQADAQAVAAEAIKRLGSAIGITAPAVEDLAEKQSKLAEVAWDMAQAQSAQRAEAGPMSAAMEQYRNRVTAAHKQVAEWAEKNGDAAASAEYLRDEIRLAGIEFGKTSTEIAKQHDILGEYMRGIEQDRALLGLTDRQKAIEIAVRKATEAYAEYNDEQRKLAGDLPSIVAGIRQIAGAFYDESRAVDAAQAVAERWASMWMGAVDSVSQAMADFAVGNIRSFADFGDAMLDIARNLVSQMLAEFAKLAALKMITGSGGSWTDIAMQAFTGSMGGGSSGGGLGGMAQNAGSSWFNQQASNYLGSMFGNGATAAYAGLMGASAAPLAGGTYAAAAPWISSASGTAAWTTGVSSGVTGMGAGSGAVTGAGASAGWASTLMAALPWIAAIIFGIYKGDQWYQEGWDLNADMNRNLGRGPGQAMQGFDQIGGNTMADMTVQWTDSLLRGIFDDRTAAALSGSSGIARFWGYRKPSIRDRDDAQGYDWNFGAEGATGNLWAQIKAKGGYFQGDKKWTETMDLDAEMQDSIDTFWSSIADRMTSLGRRFGVDAPTAIEAGFRAEYNKKGELTKSIGTIMGVQYEEAWEDFQRRIVAEQDIAFLDSTSFGRGISAYAESWRASLETLLAGTEMLMMAADHIRSGNGLLDVEMGSKSADGVLVSTATLVEELAHAGESLSDAYTRLYSSTRLVEDAADVMGARFKMTREAFIAFSADIVDLAGGLERAQTLIGSYMQNYYSQTELAARQLTEAWSASDRALTGVGLKVGTTMEEFRTAFENGIGSMTAEQIVQWYEAADVLASATNAQRAYNQALAKSALDYISLVAGLEGELGESFGFKAAEAQVRLWEQQTIDQLNALARAAGLEGAAIRDITTVHRVAADRIAKIADQLRAQIRSGAEALGYISAADTLESLNSRIAALQSTSSMAADAIGSAVDGMREKMSLLLGDLSPFNDQRKLQIALEGLAAGTVDPNQVLEIGRRLYASTANYRALFDQVMAMTNFGSRVGGGVGIDNDVSATGDGRSLDQLIADRDALLAAQRPQIADQVARRIAELSAGTNETFEAIVAAQGWTLDRLAEDLGLSNQGLLDYLESMRTRFSDTTFLDVGAMIRNAIDVSRDAIVSAITGEPEFRTRDPEATRQKPEAEGATRTATEDRRATERAEAARVAQRNMDAIQEEVRGLRRDIGNMAAAIRDYGPRTLENVR